MTFLERYAIAADVKRWIRKLYKAGFLPHIWGTTKSLWRYLNACQVIYEKERGICIYAVMGRAKDKIRIHMMMRNPECPDGTVAARMLKQVVDIARRKGIRQVYMNVTDEQDESLMRFARQYMVEHIKAIS